MHPIICQLGPIPIYSYGLMLAIAVIIASALTARDAQKLNVSADTVYDLAFWVVISGILGARLFYVSFNLDYFSANPLEAIMIWKGGLAWQGSFVAGLAAGIIYIKRRDIPLWKFLDVAAPYVALGHAIGRIGCLLNGCCYGKPAVWGLYFPVWDARLQPTQIYMTAGQIAIFLILRASQPKMKNDGQIFVFYLLLSSVERFVVEFFRADHLTYSGFSIFQYICIMIFFIALAMQYGLARKK